MTDTISKYFDFACEHPDYWALLREELEPPEVANLDPNRREAFNAARQKVQDEYKQLLDTIHAALKRKAGDGEFKDGLATSPNLASYRKAAFQFTVLRGKGRATYLRVSIEEGGNKRVAALLSIWTAARRMTKLREAFSPVAGEIEYQDDGSCLWDEEAITKDKSVADIASSLVDRFWPRLERLNSLFQKLGQDTSSDTDDDDDDG